MAAALGVAGLLGGLPAEGAGDAAPDKAACATAHGDGQVARKKGKLLDARAKLKVCAHTSCPTVLRRECAQWLDEVGPSIPSVSIQVLGDGASSAKVTLDGATVATGGVIEVDPGEHVARVESEGHEALEQPFVVQANERGKKVDLRPVPKAKAAPVASASAAPAAATAAPTENPEPSRPVPVSVYAAGAVGLVGIGAFAVLGLTANSKLSDLDSSGCKPSCAHDDVQAVRDRYLMANIALGVGVVGLGAAAVLYLTRPEEKAASGALRGLQLGLSPLGGASLRGSF